MPKHNSTKSFSIQTLVFRTTMPADKFRQLIEGAVAADCLLNESFIVGDDPSIFRLQGMHQHGDVLLSHCKFAAPVGIRLSLRFRQGDRPLVDRLVAALGDEVKADQPAGKGSFFPFEDLTVGHCLLAGAKPRSGLKGLDILPSAIESGLDFLWDDLPEITEELRLISDLTAVIVEGPGAGDERYQRAAQLMQTYEPVRTVWRQGRRLPLVHQAHLPSEDGTNVLRIHFAHDMSDGAMVIGWIDDYPLTP
jgi:hypothetical protein